MQLGRKEAHDYISQLPVELHADGSLLYRMLCMRRDIVKVAPLIGVCISVGSACLANYYSAYAGRLLGAGLAIALMLAFAVHFGFSMPRLSSYDKTIEALLREGGSELKNVLVDLVTYDNELYQLTNRYLKM